MLIKIIGALHKKTGKTNNNIVNNHIHTSTPVVNAFAEAAERHKSK